MVKAYCKKDYFWSMILVTGGTGLVGAHLLYTLLQKHDKVRATRRVSSDVNAVKEVFGFYTQSVDSSFNRIEWVEADITDVPVLSEAFIGITHVFHCAAYINFDPKKLRILRKTNVEGTANIVNLCLHNNVEKLCHISSIATLGNPLDNKPTKEDTPWIPEEQNNAYSITKYGAEMEIWRGVQEGLNAVVMNPGVILGEGFWNSGSGTIISKASKGMKYYPSGASGLVDVKDVVNASVQVMESRISGEGYILVGANMSYKKLLDKLAYHFKVKPPSVNISKWVMLFLSKLDASVNFLFGTKRRLLKPMVESMFDRTSYTAAKIEKDHQFTFTPIYETIKRVAENYSSSSS